MTKFDFQISIASYTKRYDKISVFNSKIARNVQDLKGTRPQKVFQLMAEFVQYKND